MITDVKLLMNTLYRGLNQQFVPGHSYEGGHIRAVIASTVKVLTILMPQLCFQQIAIVANVFNCLLLLNFQKEALEFVDRLEKQDLPMDSLDLHVDTAKPLSESSNSISVVKVEPHTDLTKSLETRQEEQHVPDVHATLSDAISGTESVVAQISDESDVSSQKALSQNSEFLTEDKKNQDSSLERVSCIFKAHSFISRVDLPALHTN